MKLTAIKNKVNGFKTGLMAGAVSGMNMVLGALTVHAGSDFGSGGTSLQVDDADASQAMGQVINIILDIMKYVGVAMLVYGVYEIVMSIQNNQPEAKTKGIIMALSGVVMIGIKTLLKSFGISGL